VFITAKAFFLQPNDLPAFPSTSCSSTRLLPPKALPFFPFFYFTRFGNYCSITVDAPLPSFPFGPSASFFTLHIRATKVPNRFSSCLFLTPRFLNCSSCGLPYFFFFFAVESAVVLGSFFATSTREIEFSSRQLCLLLYLSTYCIASLHCKKPFFYTWTLRSSPPKNVQEPFSVLSFSTSPIIPTPHESPHLGREGPRLFTSPVHFLWKSTPFHL